MSKKTKVSKFAKELEAQSLRWEENPEIFMKEGFHFLKKSSEKHIEALDVLLQLCVQKSDPELINSQLIKFIRNNETVKKVIEFLFVIYINFSDDVHDQLFLTSLLNEISDDDPLLLLRTFSLLSGSDQKQKAIELYEETRKKFPDVVGKNELDLMSVYCYSEIPEYIEKGFEMAKKFDITTVNLEQAIQVGSLKFYSGLTKDGLIYHFGGEDYRPPNFVNKKEIPNRKSANFNGKSIVVTTYRGLGDTMLLSRFLPHFMKKWPECDITIATEKSLIPLYKGIHGLKFVGTTDSCSGKLYDHCLGVNMLSRYVIDETVDENENILYHEWVKYPESYDEKWKDIIQKDASKKLIGFNWKGSQRLGGAGKSDVNLSRDITVEEIINIVDLYDNMNFMVLNNHITKQEREVLSSRTNIIIPEGIEDFGDTSALINLCDHIVSTDTSISTLSATLSKDTTVMAKFFPDYRWLHYEKWWDLSKVNIDVIRKESYDAHWTNVLLKVAIKLKTLN